MFDLQAMIPPKHLSIDNAAIYFDGGSEELLATDETKKSWSILLKCVWPDDLPPGKPVNFDWLLCVNGQLLKKYSEEEKHWIRLIEEASVPPDEIEDISNWDEDKRGFVFQGDVEAMQRAEKAGLVTDLSVSRSDFCEKYYSVRKDIPNP